MHRHYISVGESGQYGLKYTVPLKVAVNEEFKTRHVPDMSNWATTQWSSVSCWPPFYQMIIMDFLIIVSDLIQTVIIFIISWGNKKE